MTDTTTAPYGSWKSPITSDLIVSDFVRLAEPSFDGEDIYWTELRPPNAGRITIVKRTADGQTTDVTPPEFNARTRVHEYGGGAYIVQDGVLWSSNYDDQRLYRIDPGGEPVALSPEVDLRYADGVFDSRRNLIYAVREDHTGEGEAVNTVVSLSATEPGDGGDIVASGCDFYSNPRLSPDGSRLAWLQWNHPNMPWDGTELHVAQLDEAGRVVDSQQIAGGLDESVLQPQWSPRGTLYFISDRSGWWNLYRVVDGQVQAVFPKDAEFVGPSWVFRLSNYGFESDESLLCIYSVAGKAQLTRLHTATIGHDGGPKTELIETPFSSIHDLDVSSGQAVFLGGSPTKPMAITQLDLTTGEAQSLRQASNIEIDSSYVSVGQTIEFPTENGQTAHAFYYPPRNADFAAPDGERPPLLVRSHGGPTSATSRDFSLSNQYWTSRGYAFLDVNYGGSTGYGRDYRNRLRGNWGIIDIDDCINAAKFLVEQGLADADRTAIDGGSAGGYTTLGALAFRDFFRAGCSHFGLSELTVFVEDTHKFESRYLDSLIGPWPEREDLYRERSPINSVDQLSCPCAFFQGDEDKIVPPNQAKLMVEALRQKKIPVSYVLFEGEQHGFRKSENIKRALDGEYYFFARIFGISPADDLEPLEIENLE